MKKATLIFVSAALIGLAILLPQMAPAQGAGKALNFDGENDYVTIGPVTSGQTLTYEFWMKALEFKDKATVLWDDDQDSGNDSWIQITSEGKVQTKGDFQEITSSISLQLNTWYHVAFVADVTGGTKLYINGIQRASQSNPIGTRTEHSYVSLGMGYDGSNPITAHCAYFKGEIDEVRIWDVALTEAQMREMMCKSISSGNLPSGLDWSDLLGYWRLDEGSGTTASDQTANRDGTLHGPSWTNSGAAIGDTSAYDYSGGSPSDFSAAISHSDGDQLTAKGYGGTVEGIQVYRADSTSMRDGATKPDGWTLDSKRYWGVFITGSSPTYTVTYNYDNRSDISDESSLGLAFRRNQGDDHWKDAGATLDMDAHTLTKTGQVGSEYALGNPAASIEYASGKALDFDGTDDYIDCGANASLDITDSLTVEAWVKVDNFVDVGGIVTYGGEGEGTKETYALATRTSNKFAFMSNWPDDWQQLFTESSLNEHVWYHIAGVFASGSAKIYVNGNLDNSANWSISSLPLNPDRWLQIGLNAPGASEYFDGKIDEVRIWDVALDSTTIRDWMCKKVTSSHPQWSHLKGYWRFDESSGTSCDDYSQNSNIGTMMNMDPATDRVWSGAALGDASTDTYTTNWTDVTVSLAHSDGDSIMVNSVANSPDGVHIYRVDEAPNVTTPPSGWEKLDPLRYWGVFVVGGSSPTYTVTYNYDGHPGIADESALRLAKRADGSATSWTDTGVEPNTVHHTLTKSGESGTEYILGTTSSDNSLPVALTSFTATDSAGVVVVKWVVESEVGNAWFYLFRSSSPEGQYIRIAQIPGRGSATSRYEYCYIDRSVTPGQSYWYKLVDVSYQGESIEHGPVGVMVLPEQVPEDAGLQQNYPNPFNPATIIRYRLPEGGWVSLAIYNTRGQLVRTLVEGREKPGYKSFRWDGRDSTGEYVASGVYLYVLKVDHRLVETRKMAVIR